MSLNNPIFIVGTGRCGSTLFHDILCRHSQLAWLSQLAAKHTRKLWLNSMAMSAIHIPVLASIMRKMLYPAEPYIFWEKYCPGFSRPFRDLLRSDVTPCVRKSIRKAVSDVIPNKYRFIAKITGWPRVSYLKNIFPDAKFVHIYRDGRAVVNSVISAPYFDGWSGPNAWTRGELTDKQHKYWEESGKSFIILAAIGWENRMAAFERVKAEMCTEDYLEIKYEEFCSNPSKVLTHVLEYAGLDKDEDFIHKTSVAYAVKNQNDKWKVDLDKDQQKLLNDYLSPILATYGY